MKKSAAVALSFCVAVLAAAQSSSPDLTRISDPTIWRLHNRSAKFVDDAGRRAVQLDARDGDGMAWLVGSDGSFANLKIARRTQ